MTLRPLARSLARISLFLHLLCVQDVSEKSMAAELATMREQHTGSRAALESAHEMIATDKQKREHLQVLMRAR